jgi:hypothetical protein
MLGRTAKATPSPTASDRSMIWSGNSRSNWKPSGSTNKAAGGEPDDDGKGGHMTIFSRFGATVTIQGYDGDAGGGGVFKVRYVGETYPLSEVRIGELKADGGVREIFDAVNELPDSKRSGVTL